MSAAAVEPPCDGKSPLLREAERLAERLPGYRIEIIGGTITVTPPPDGPHGESLSDLLMAFAPLHAKESKVIQGIGIWLPDGPDDYAVPDLAVVDADYRRHHIAENCYDPAVFRLVLEVTSSNYQNDLKKKVGAYAIAKVPVYVIVDRKHDRLHVLQDPVANEYDKHRVHARGEHVALPGSIGTDITLDVEAILETARP
ncbi:membrane protein [Streptomyces nigrescens]|uniref:Membrane protein n=2 Tax=Streptomyces TaxID=1883 RepID=A0ABM8A1M2_STRNI|nr:Uma2 family endonuclease [Streptomyces nigrescens]MEE4421669.1 Uma2 family endonuclease [Streptomyces sp. DSM 41528]BDM72518.1 membrane protein [Streptomyces nigrescens]